MCVIIYKPKEVKIEEKLVRAAFNYNPHGAGMVIREGTTTVSQKGFFSFDSLWKAVNSFQDYELAIHCRIATSGLINGKFCHPFKVNPDSYLFHNGIIPKFGNNKFSDSYVLSKVLEKHTDNKEEILTYLAEKTYSKFLLMNGQNLFFGDWKDYEGLKLSNGYFLPKSKISYNHVPTKSFITCPTCETIRPRHKYMCTCGDTRLF